MHVLTKIFVVLVSLLAVLLVPLVVVYAHNEDNYKARYEISKADTLAATRNLAQTEARYGAEVNRIQAEKQQLDSTVADVRGDLIAIQAEISGKDQMLAAEQTMKAEIDAKLATLASALDASQRLTETLVDEVRGLRTDTISLERQKIELDDALRDSSGQLEVAVQARRALQEQVQRLKEELAMAASQVAGAVAQGFNPDSKDRTVNLATVNLDARVINVRRRDGETLAEIDAGSLDGIQVGNTLQISRGGAFKGTLRVLKVDVRSATGILSLEDASAGRAVEVGDTAHARVGQN